MGALARGAPDEGTGTGAGIVSPSLQLIGQIGRRLPAIGRVLRETTGDEDVPAYANARLGFDGRSLAEWADCVQDCRQRCRRGVTLERRPALSIS